MPVKVKARKSPNPLRMDPTRTASLRRAFERQLTSRFEKLRAKLMALLLDEDALGLEVEKRDIYFSHPVLGRNYLYVNCGGPGSGVPGPCPSGVTSDEANKGRSFTNRLKALGAKAGEIEHALKEQIASKIALLPQPLQVGLSVAYHTAFAGWTASQALAERVAIERGSTPEQAAKLRGVLAAVDIALFKPVAIGLSASGVGAGAQSLTWIVPPATGAYLAYSTVRNPIKTARAAYGLVRDSLRAAAGGILDRVSLVPQTGNAIPDLADLMADALEAHDYDDWYVAIFTQALSLDLSPQEAVAMANEVYAKNPTSPTGAEDDLDSDAEELFGVKTDNSSLTINAGRWQFATDPQKVKEFKRWLRQEIGTELTGRSEKELWEAYTRLGLQKGAGRAFDDTRRPQKIQAELSGKSDFYAGTKDEFLRSSFNKPVAVEKVQLLAERSFDEMEDMTATMAMRMTRHLTDGLVQGKGPREIARDLDRDLDIGRNRSLVIARTEIVRAHAEGQLMALEQLGVEEVGVAVEWSTAGDDHVCELCQPLEGVVLKLDEAKGMLPRHPNCRCAWIPANVGEDPKDQKDTEASIGRALDISVERGGGFERSRWGGADLEPDEDRPESQVGNTEVDYLALFSRNLWTINCGGPGSGIPGPCPTGIKDKPLSPGHKRAKIKGQSVVLKISEGGKKGTVVEGPPEMLGRILTKKSPAPSTVAPPAATPDTSPTTKTTPSPTKSSGKSGQRPSLKTPEDTAKHFSKTHKTDIRPGKLSTSDYLKVAEAVESDFSSLRGRFKVVDKTFKQRGREQKLEVGKDFEDTPKTSGYLGRYVYGEGIQVSKDLKITDVAPTIGQYSIGRDFGSTLRHELGHEVFDMTFSRAKRAAWGKIAKKYVGTSTVTRYGGTNEAELFSESFGAYTSKKYQRGSLPKDLENFLDRQLGVR